MAKRTVSLRVLALAAGLLPAALAQAQTAGAPRTLRVDYFHTGTATEERFTLDRVVVEPLPWPGSPAQAIDDTNLGKYLFEVRAPESKALLFSRGFASIFGEWQTTGEAQEIGRTFHESLRFPEPSKPVRVTLSKRGARNEWLEIWSLTVDPKDMFVDPSLPPSPGPLVELEVHGPSPEKVDFLIVGDGYTAAERSKFERDARRLVDILFTFEPFKSRRADFNVWGLAPAAAESGISRPSTGIHHRSLVGATYDAFGSERYVLTFENRSFRDVAAFAPYEFVEVLTNSRTYGGGGIFGLYSTVAADSLWSPYVFVHEFGHHFAGLADEYYTSDVAYEPAVDRLEPWEENVTALKDPAQLKWRDLVAPGTPVPTPWRKEEFETHAAEIRAERRRIRAENRPEDEMDALFLRQQAVETKLLGSEPFAGKVGAFEGAMYEARGYYRPQADCVMFSRNEVPFCAVCQRAIERVIDHYSAERP